MQACNCGTDHRGGQRLRCRLPRHRQSDVGGRGSSSDVGGTRTLHGHNSHPRLGGIRNSTRRGGAVGGAGRWRHRFSKIRRPIPRAVPGLDVQLENITGRPPTVLPYLEADFWKAFPKARAAEFARFVEIARTGHPFMGLMVIEDGGGKATPEERSRAARATAGRPSTRLRLCAQCPGHWGEVAQLAALREQQRVDLQRGFDDAGAIPDIGVRWRS